MKSSSDYVGTMYMLFKHLFGDFAMDHILVFISYFAIIIFIFPLEGILFPKLTAKLYKVIQETKKFADPYNIKDNLKLLNAPGLIVATIILMAIGKLADIGKFAIESHLNPTYFKYLRSAMFAGTVNRSVSQYKDIKSAEYLARGMELTRNVRDLFHYMLGHYIPYLVMTLVYAVYLAYTVPGMWKIILGGSLILIMYSMYTAVQAMDLARDREDFFMNNVAEELQSKLGNMMNIVVNNQGDEAIASNDAMEEISRQKMKKIMDHETVAMGAMDAIMTTMYGAGAFALYGSVSEGIINVETTISSLLVLGNLTSSLNTVGYGLMYNVAYRLGVITSGREFINDAFTFSKKTKGDTVITPGDIHFRNVTFGYKDDEPVIAEYNLDIARGEKVAIMGQSGSGKTTLMKLLVGLHRPSAGKVTIGNTDVSTVDKTALREYVNYNNQRTAMFNGTVLDNMRYGHDRSPEDIRTMLEKYDLTGVFINGLDADVGIGGGELSLGMQKVTMLVRGICRNSHVLVLDEPLAGLDNATRKKVIKLIVDETEKKTLVVITHDPDILPFMDRVINMDDR